MMETVEGQLFICVGRVRSRLCGLLLCLVLFAPLGAANDGSSCQDAKTVLRGDYWFTPNRSLWFTGSYNTVSQGFSCFWFSQDTLFIDAYYSLFSPSCPGTFIKTFKAVPNGTFDLSPDMLNEKVREKCLEYLGIEPTPAILGSLYANLHIYAKTGLEGRMFINQFGVAPQSSPQGPFSATEYNSYLVNKQTNAYYQITWDKAVKPDSIYVFWQPSDSAEDFRTDLLAQYPSIQFRQHNSAGEAKGVAQRFAGQNRYWLRQPAYDVAISNEDSLFVQILNAPDNGHFKFCGLYLSEENYTETMCEGNELCLTNGCYGVSGQYRDTTGWDFWHRTYRNYDLTVKPVVYGRLVELEVPQLPVEYNDRMLYSEGMNELFYTAANGCDSIQPVRVKVESALPAVAENSISVVPAQPRAGEPMTVLAPQNHTLYIYDLSGGLVLEGRAGQPLTAPNSGLYLLRIGTAAVKIRIK